MINMVCITYRCKQKKSVISAEHGFFRKKCKNLRFSGAFQVDENGFWCDIIRMSSEKIAIYIKSRIR
jgi:hypothetical protein